MTTRSSVTTSSEGLSRGETSGVMTAHLGSHDDDAEPSGDVHGLARRFTELTHLLYDTSVPVAVLQEKVYPLLGSDITFRDPWIRGKGLSQFWTGLRGFHAIVRFTFDITQLAVQMNARGNGGRVLVDGTMNLNQLVVYTYPLRTQLVYEFTISPDGEDLEVHALEEMWSFGDLFQNLPGLGMAYEAFRWSWGAFFTGVFWTAANVVERLPWERARSEEARAMAG